jgi:hypothetical protein
VAGCRGMGSHPVGLMTRKYAHACRMQCRSRVSVTACGKTTFWNADQLCVAENPKIFAAVQHLFAVSTPAAKPQPRRLRDDCACGI